MIELGIDKNFIVWISAFFTDQKILLVIDKHKNVKREIEMRILQGLLFLPILFLIYINGVFDLVFKVCS